MSISQPSVSTLYLEYIKLRESGLTAEDAVRTMQPMVTRLDKGDVPQLTALVQSWEALHGQFHKPSARPAPIAEAPKPTPIRPIKAVTSGPAPDSRACPKCGKPNRRTDTYCYSCGEPLQSSRSATRALSNAIMNPRAALGTAYFGQDSTIVIIVRGAPKSLEFTLENEAVIGRSAPDSAMKPDIDLSAYDAENLGVSRLHASLKRQDNTVAITDLNSKNSTYINGQRLHPHEVRVLRDGDEIRLSKLAMRIVFKHRMQTVS